MNPEAGARESLKLLPPMRVDLHSHSTVSDGLDSPAELVRLMAYAGISAFSLTDHDSLQGLPEARARSGERSASS